MGARISVDDRCTWANARVRDRPEFAEPDPPNLTVGRQSALSLGAHHFKLLLQVNPHKCAHPLRDGPPGPQFLYGATEPLACKPC